MVTKKSRDAPIPLLNWEVGMHENKGECSDHRIKINTEEKGKVWLLLRGQNEFNPLPRKLFSTRVI